MTDIEKSPFHLIQRHLDDARASYKHSPHAHAWCQPRAGMEHVVRDTIRAWAGLAEHNESIAHHPQFGRYFKAQALALRAMVETFDMGRFQAIRLRQLVIDIGEAGGIDWKELEQYDEE